MKEKLINGAIIVLSVVAGLCLCNFAIYLSSAYHAIKYNAQKQEYDAYIKWSGKDISQKEYFILKDAGVIK